MRLKTAQCKICLFASDECVKQRFIWPMQKSLNMCSSNLFSGSVLSVSGSSDVVLDQLCIPQKAKSTLMANMTIWKVEKANVFWKLNCSGIFLNFVSINV